MSRMDWLAFGFAFLIAAAILDVVTTIYGLSIPGLMENNPIANSIFETFGIYASIPIKMICIVGVVALMRFVGEDATSLPFIAVIWWVGLLWMGASISNMYHILTL